MGRAVSCVLVVAAAVAGCGRGAGSARADYYDALPPLPIQQVRAYAETVTGRFVSLADFEDAGLTGRPGHQQVKDFVIGGKGHGRLRFVVNRTRTGVGAMDVLLGPGGVLEYRLPDMHDFSGYSLLSLAVHSEAIRDDLKLLISTDRAAWESLPVLLRPGWNDVLIDLHRLKALPDFRSRSVGSIRLWFSAAAGPVSFGLDDILLIDNRREITPVPEGMRLVKEGLDYRLDLPGRPAPIRIRQGDDGLWRLGPDQPVLALRAEDAGLAPAGGGSVREDLSVMGPNRVGQVEVLEHNAVRLRVAVTWYFPASAGQWASMAVRQVRWEYTFYGDGRCVTEVTLNNAGGRGISSVRLTAGATATFSDGAPGPVGEVRPFVGPAHRWAFLTGWKDVESDLFAGNYLKPADVEIRMGERVVAPGDADADGFDESQGCYRLRARAGHCRFVVSPPAGGLADAVFLIQGDWSSKVTAHCDGRAVRNLVRLTDGSALFVLPGVIKRRSRVEVTGKVPPLSGR